MRHAGMRMSLTSSEQSVNIADFINKASEKGIAEIDAALIAKDKVESVAVKKFAERMIREHERINQKLRELARKKGLETADDAALLDKIKKMGLQLRQDESFDKAYLRNQIGEHKRVVTLFEEAMLTDDQEISDFVKNTLPLLREHLYHAQQLYATL